MSEDEDEREGGREVPDRLTADEVEEHLDEIEGLQEEADEGGGAGEPRGPSGAEPVRPPGDGVDLGGVADEGGPDATEPGRPNVARGPDAPGPQGEPVEAYLGAVELYARLPEGVRLPAEAADVVPVVIEESLRRRITDYVALEFEAEEPRVARIGFEEVEGAGVWMKMRIGADPAVLEDLSGNLDGLRRAALEQLEALMDQGGPD